MKSEDIDRLSLSLLSLAREVWVLKDRQRILENLLEKKGIVAPELIDKHNPGEAEAEKTLNELKAFVDSIMLPLVERP